MDNDKRHVREMFGDIAPRYDLLNRLMTFGQDIRWRRILVRELALNPASVVLDIGCGTGDLAREIRRQSPGTVVVAADFTPEMVKLGKERTHDPGIRWLIADAQHLPFKDEAFSAVVSGYLLRNVPDLDRVVSEQHRVSCSNSRIASLDTTPPENNWLRPLLEFYLNTIIPLLGRLVARSSFAYQYLSRSTHLFLTADQLADKIQESGYQDVKYQKLMFRTMAIHQGRKTPLN